MSAEMDEEMCFHLEMEAERLQRERGLDPAEARRQAAVAFGGVEKFKAAGHDARGLAWLGGLTLDLKLGGRMLVKYPGLTVVGGLAMAFAIWVGVVIFEMVMLFVSPTLPLPEGDRIVHLRNWDVQANDPEPRALHDFVVWRQAMRSVTDFGAWEDVTRNLAGRDGEVRPVQVAAITASGFHVAATPPLLGRPLVPADERAEAPPVVVLGHDVWRARFAGDSAIVGQTVQLGEAYATVVGVMPDGFAFPVAHDAWTPFRPDVLDDAPLSGPGITIFGRLAPGATLDDAQAELTALGLRAAREFPDTHEHLRPQVMPYAQMFTADLMSAGEGGIVFGLIQLFALMLLVLVCGNVALLLFARAATRESEIIVRSALGASRRRIVVQLFAEALVLGAVAAAVGLAAAYVALRQWGLPFLEANLGQVPFWYDPRLSPVTVLYACALTVLGAAIAGALPGLKVTRGLGSRLRERHGRRRRPEVRRRVDRGDRRAGGGDRRVPRRGARRIEGAEPDPLVRPRVRGRGIPRGEPGEGCAAGRGRGQRDDGGPPRAVRDGARDAPPARRGRAGGASGSPSWTTSRSRTTSTTASPSTIRRPSPRRRRGGRTGGQRPLRYTTIAHVDPSYFDVLGAPILAAGDSRPPTSLPARGWRSSTRASWTRCCWGATRSAGGCGSPTAASSPTARAPTRSPGTRSWAS
jgi:putative ABC transport system permease protein